MTGTAEARRLAEPDVARDHGVEDERREVLAHLALDVLRRACVRASCIVSSIPATVRRGLSSRWISAERVEQAGEALEREVLGLDRHDHAVGGDQRVDGQRAERRRAVEQR